MEEGWELGEGERGEREGRGGEEEGEKKCRNEWKIMQFTPAPRRVRPVTCTLARQRKLTDGQREECGLAILAAQKKVAVGPLRIAVTE